MYLQNEVVILTGASSGIGKALAFELAKKGAKLVLVSRNKEKLDQIASKLNEIYSVEVLVLSKDLTLKEDIERTVEKTISYFNKIDALINCSGVGSFKRAVDFTYEEIDYIFKLNTFGMIYLAQLVANEMIIKNIPGHILFVASVASKIATPHASIYSASKFAITGYANSLRLELKRFGIKVTTINPGPTQTDFFNHDKEAQAYYQQVKRFSLKPEKLAKEIVHHMQVNRIKREIIRPRFFALVNILYQLFPRTGDFLAGDVFNLKENES